jgi:hypothetical protein
MHSGVVSDTITRCEHAPQVVCCEIMQSLVKRLIKQVREQQPTTIARYVNNMNVS